MPRDEQNALLCERMQSGGKPASPCVSCIAELDGDNWYHAQGCPVAKKLRDEYCTPAPLAEALGRFTLDVASNRRSLIHTDRVCGTDFPEFITSSGGWAGHDSLAISWADEDVFCNGPFSNLLPFAEKLHEARSFVFLCNTDHSTAWWRAAVKSGGHYRFDLATRQQFDPPPHIRRSTNNKPQSLLCDVNAYCRIAHRLTGMGTWWLAARSAA